MKRNRMLSALLAAGMTLSLAACGGGKTPDPTGTPTGDVQGETKAVYRSLYASEVTTLNYLYTTQANETSITFNVVDCLVEYDSYGKVEPALALSWESNEDATVWTFKLREGVKWVDWQGNEVAEVTAQDWVTSARYVCDAKNDCSTFSTMDGIVAGAAEYYEYTAYLMALEGAEDGTDENGNPCKLVPGKDGAKVVLEEVPEASVEDIGVKAIDKYTLEYTLAAPCPYFISMISFGAFMPVNADFLASCGDKFGTDKETLLYCGAFILSDFQPQQQRVMTKNPSYWESEQVFIDEIRDTYNAEASSISATMYLQGNVDAASVSSDLLTAMLGDPKTADQIHPSRPDTSYSYWYLFNFDPQFDAEYEPENWKIAVNNENFRQSVVHAMNRIPALAANDAINPTGNMSNTITPAGFCAADGKDFTAFEALSSVTGEYYDEAAALSYKEAAMTELAAAGATFPIKMLMCYNPTSSNWANECQVVEQQIEKVLGTDYIDIIVKAGPDTGFLGAVRRSGKYGFMKCNWGADYADPQTWTDPFTPGSSYSFIYRSEDPATVAVYNEYLALVEKAKGITTDMTARYEAFAEAEAMLISHAFALPIHTNSISYSMSKLNVFEGQYAPFGGASARYKDQHILEKSMSIDEFNAAYAEWRSHMG